MGGSERINAVGNLRKRFVERARRVIGQRETVVLRDLTRLFAGRSEIWRRDSRRQYDVPMSFQFRLGRSQTFGQRLFAENFREGTSARIAGADEDDDFCHSFNECVF